MPRGIFLIDFVFSGSIDLINHNQNFLLEIRQVKLPETDTTCTVILIDKPEDNKNKLAN